MYEPAIKIQVRNLRTNKGLTFKEIKNKFPYLSKGTISDWVRGIKLKPEHEKRILEKQLKRRIEFQLYNKKKHEISVRETKQAIARARKEIGELS